jgi:hypothetical protein
MWSDKIEEVADRAATRGRTFPDVGSGFGQQGQPNSAENFRKIFLNIYLFIDSFLEIILTYII